MMLSEKIKKFLQQNKWLDLELEDAEYDKVLQELNIPLDSAFAEFQRFTTLDSFSTAKAAEIFNICWESLYGDFHLLAESLWENRPWGNLPKNFVPFSHYSGDSLLLYDTVGQGVYYVNDAEINEIIQGEFAPQWRNFNEFLEYYFEVEVDDFVDAITKTELSTNIKIEYQNEQEKITSNEQLESRLSELREILTITNSKGVKCIGTVDVVVENLGRMSIALDERCILQFYDEVDDIYFNSLGDPLFVGDTADLYDFGQPSVSCEKYVVPYVVGLAALKGWLVSEKLGAEISWTEE